MRLALPAWTVAEAGAPAQVWLTYTSPPGSDSLFVDVTWVNKTATRLPEVASASAVVSAIVSWSLCQLTRYAGQVLAFKCRACAA